MKDPVLKPTLILTGFFILIFWLIVQESARVDLQGRIEKLEQQVKTLSARIIEPSEYE